MKKVVRVYEPGNGYTDIEGKISFEEVRNQINGYIEIVYLSKICSIKLRGLCTFCDEDGKYKNLKQCIMIRSDLGENVLFVGKIFIGEMDRDGDLVPVDETVLDELSNIITVL